MYEVSISIRRGLLILTLMGGFIASPQEDHSQHQHAVAGLGTVDVTVDMTSADFGQEQLNKGARGKDLFETAKYPQARYTGKLVDFVNGAPTRVTGKLTLHGVTHPLDLKIDSFKCMPHPVFKREVCGADALATFRRDTFGIDAGKDYGFGMDVTLRIQVEAIAAK